MGQFYDEIPAFLIPWLEQQKMFWVATAPLAEDGHVNVSPKGCFEGTFNIIRDESESLSKNEKLYESEGGKKGPGSRAVWYEDLTGSGIETISHLRENGRITILFTAFEGPPRIVRLFGTGKVYEFGTPEYNALRPLEKRQPGSRAVIWIDVHKVGTSCGYSIPFFDYKAPRFRLHKFASGREQADYDTCSDSESLANSDSTVVVSDPELPTKGLRNYWKSKNIQSIDGLPGLLFAFASKERLGDWRTKGEVFRSVEDDESVKQGTANGGVGLTAKSGGIGGILPVQFGLIFGIGVVTGTLLSRLYK